MWQLDWSKLAEVLTYDPQQPMIFGHRDGERFPACPANGAYRCALETETVGRDQLVH